MKKLSNKKLLVIGVEENESIIQAAHEMGVYVILIDRNADKINSLAKEMADEIWTMDYSDIESVSKKCIEENVSGVIAGYSEFKVLYAAKISEKIGLPFYATPEQIEITRNKRKFKDLCIKYGVPIAKDYCFSKFNNDEEMENVKFPLIVKPTDYAGCKGITVCNNHSELIESVNYALKYSESGTIICEEYIKGTEIMVIYTIADGKISLSSVGEKYISQDHDGIAGLCDCALAPSKYLDVYLEQADSSIRKLMEGIGIKNGVAFFQGIATKDNVKIFEMGYRLNGNNDCKIIEKYNGINYMKMLISYSLTGSMGDDLTKDNPRFSKTLCTLCTYLNEGTVGKVNYDKIVDNPNIDDIYSYAYVGKVISNEDSSQRRGIFVKINADSIDEIKKVINYVQANIEVLDVNGNNMLFKPFDANRLT